jgi:hypothetical protein
MSQARPRQSSVSSTGSPLDTASLASTAWLAACTLACIRSGSNRHWPAAAGRTGTCARPSSCSCCPTLQLPSPHPPPPPPPPATHPGNCCCVPPCNTPGLQPPTCRTRSPGRCLYREECTRTQLATWCCCCCCLPAAAALLAAAAVASKSGSAPYTSSSITSGVSCCCWG